MRDDSSDSILAKLGRFCFDGCVPFTESTYKAVIASRDIALSASQIVYGGDRAAFALCRPPGHHAGPNYAGGYCFLNNAAIAAQWLRDAGANRVAILDIDYHHGNGTQEIFYNRSDVAVASIHADPKSDYPFYAGHADETGNGEGKNYNLNLPLPKGTEYESWNNAFSSAAEFISSYAPDYLIVSMGLDTFKDDPISSFKLASENYGSIGANIAALGLPTVFIFEGGYAIAQLGDNAAALLLGFEGRS
jgi:acetoin utilization deacetylase AcuC-like enzyme